MKTPIITQLLAVSLALLPFSDTRGADALLTDDASVDFVAAGRQAVGTAPLLRVDPSRQRSYLKFDLASTLPSGIRSQHIAKATLRLFVSRVASPGSVGLSILADPWNEASLTPAAAAQLRDSFTGTSRHATVERANTFIVFDVTEYVRYWADGRPNNGFVLRGAGGAAAFDSKENTATGHEPLLQVIFSSLPEPVIITPGPEPEEQ